MLKKTLVNCFLLTWLVVIAIDAAPEIGIGHRYLKDKLDPLLDKTGLWQGQWKLFAPEPDQINVGITAEITYGDGQISVWHSPQWRSLSAWQRFLQFRHAEFIDNVRKDENSCVWPSYADYLARTVPHPEGLDVQPTNIVLSRQWVMIPPPNPVNISEFPEPPPYNGSYIFFAKDY